MLPPSLREIENRLEIDEEGYPVFGGLRIHDEAVLRDVFGNLSRSQPEMPRSKIVTCLEGKTWAWVDAFDAPLVAQSASLELADRVKLGFLGGRVETVDLLSFQIDEWDRFHSLVGADEMPAVLSRKAQAMLLRDISLRTETPRLAAFRDPGVSRPGESQFWSEIYEQHQDGWELGQPHPVLATRDWARFSAVKRVLVPGAGRGSDAAFLAGVLPQARVTALDFAPQARLDALAKFKGHLGFEYECQEVFEFLRAQETASFDLVFEHTFFCAIDPLKRSDYVRELSRVLKPGGRWMGIFFLLEHAGGPPFATTQWELREHTRERFDVFAWERISQSPSGRTHKELWSEFVTRSI
jgi:SAM-dependent methyltransferase